MSDRCDNCFYTSKCMGRLGISYKPNGPCDWIPSRYRAGDSLSLAKIVMEKRSYCTNSRRWLDFVFTNAPRGCSEKDCLYNRCGYYEERPPNAYYRRKMKILLKLYK